MPADHLVSPVNKPSTKAFKKRAISAPPGPTRKLRPIELQAALKFFRRQSRAVMGPILKPLLDDIENLLYAMGVAHKDDVFSCEVRKWVAKRPSNRVLAIRFGAIASADHPLLHPKFRESISAIGAMLRGRWKGAGPSPTERLLTQSADQFNEKEIQQVKEAATQLAHHHDNLSRNRTNRREDLDTLLIELADIFATHSRFEWSRYELGKAERSRFIQFAHVILSPFLPARHVSPNALYSRWKRLQRDSRNNGQGIGAPIHKAEQSRHRLRTPSRWKNKRKLASRN